MISERQITDSIIDILITAIDASNPTIEQMDKINAAIQEAIESSDAKTALEFATAKLQINQDFCSRNQTLNCKREIQRSAVDESA